MPSPLASAHIEAERRLRVLVRRAIERIWGDLPGVRDRHVDEWLARALPVIEAGRRTSVALTDGYIATQLRRAPLGIGLEDLPYRSGADPREVYTRPVITTRAKLSEGLPYSAAASAGLGRATGMAAFDIQAAMAEAAAAIGEADPAIERWQRVADPDCCDFCTEVDGAILLSADPMPLHNHCGCGVEPLTEAVEVTEPPEAVAIEEHGEMGALLVDPAQEFTTI